MDDKPSADSMFRSPDLKRFEEALAALVAPNHLSKRDLELMYRCGWEAAVAMMDKPVAESGPTPKGKPE